MAYRIDADESFADALERMAREELRDARAAIAPGRAPLGGAVHDVRTGLKKVRALVRLVRPAVGRPARREDRRMRALARTVSAVRDAEVVVSTFDALARALPAAVRARLGPVRRRLAQRRAEAKRPFSKGGRGELGDALDRAAARVARWTRPRGAWRAVGPGLARGYARARRAMKAAYATPNGGAFHAWRRAAKTHRHQAHVLEAICPRALRPRAGALERLAQGLGDEHDLTVLGETLVSERGCFVDAHDEDVVLRALARRQDALRARLRPLGARLFAEVPAAFARRAHAEMRAFRRRGRGRAHGRRVVPSLR